MFVAGFLVMLGIIAAVLAVQFWPVTLAICGSLAVLFIGALIYFSVNKPSTKEINMQQSATTYPSEYRSNFLTACLSVAGSPSIQSCTCALNTVEASYSYSEAVTFETTGFPASLISQVRAVCQPTYQQSYAQPLPTLNTVSQPQPGGDVVAGNASLELGNAAL